MFYIIGSLLSILIFIFVLRLYSIRTGLNYRKDDFGILFLFFLFAAVTSWMGVVFEVLFLIYLLIFDKLLEFINSKGKNEI